MFLSQELLEGWVMSARAFLKERSVIHAIVNLLNDFEQLLCSHTSNSFLHSRLFVVMVDEAPQDVGKTLARRRQSA